MVTFRCNYFSKFDKMNKKGIFLILISVIISLSPFGQARKLLRFNEVMVQNDSNYIDQLGNRTAWFEVFNSSYASVGMEQMFITTVDAHKAISDYNDVPAAKKKEVMQEFCKNNPDVAYEIPRGDADTKVAPRTHVVFFADGNSTTGALHVSFKLTPGKENDLYLYDVNGDLVSFVKVPATLKANNAFGAITESYWSKKSELDKYKQALSTDDPNALWTLTASQWEVRDGSNDNVAITPMKYNASVVNLNVEKFAKGDPNGTTLTLIAMGIVFSALLLLFIVFWLFGQANSLAERKHSGNEDAVADDAPVQEVQAAADDDMAVVAICMAMYQHLNAHDEESGVLTFDRNADTAWSSKANMMCPTPNRK